MAENKLISIVGFINQNSISFFWDKIKSPITFNFPTGSVGDLEVRKPEVLANAFREFLEQIKLLPSQIYLIISSDQVFESEFPAKDADEAKIEIETFLKSVPFEHVANRVYVWGKGCKVAAINRELFETLQSVLESQENVVLAVTPAGVLMEYLKQGFNINSAKQLLSKVDLIRQNSFIYQEEVKEEESQKGSDPRKNKKLLTMLIIFGLLLAFLGVLAFRMMEENKELRSRKLPPSTVTVAPPAAAPQATPPIQTVAEIQSATTSAAVYKNLKVEVINSTGTVGLAANTKNRLIQLGFENVVTSNGSTLNSAKQLVGFGPTVSEPTRKSVISDFSKLFGEILVQELTSPTVDIAITLTKSSTVSATTETAP